jgi:PPE-repeat protein
MHTTYWLVAVLASFTAVAANAENCNGRFDNVTHALYTIEVAKEHTLTSFILDSITTSDNSINNAAAECSGYALTNPDGNTRISSICAR